jgi:nitrite reductase/ring-hydroxylating ferredoxin subunit
MFKFLRSSIFLLTVFLFIVFFTACEENYRSPIPNYPVGLKIDLTGQYNTFKNSSNQFLFFEVPPLATDRIGYGGILLYSGLMPDDYGNTVYYAFDMACPYEAERTIRVYPVQDSLPGIVRCEECGSEFNVAYGFGDPVKGPATKSLKPYRVSLSGESLFVNLK